MITSVQNPTVIAVTKLHQKKYRDETGTFLVIGEHEITEALKMYEPVKLFSLDNSFTKVSVQVMKKIARNSTPKQLGVFRKKRFEIKNKKVLVLENVQNPGNVGTLLRSAVAFGFNDVILIGGVDLYHPSVISSSEGYFFHLNICHYSFHECLNILKDYTFLFASPHFGSKVELTQPIALWLGNEGSGLSEKALSQNGQYINIKTETVESLNIAVAGSILMNDLKEIK